MQRGTSKVLHDTLQDIGKGDGTMEKTHVLRRGVMPNGTCIQLENWHDIYDFKPANATIGAYPIAKESCPSIWAGEYPKKGEAFRCFFEFNNEEDALEAYTNLICGYKCLVEYLDNYSGDPEYKKCI